MPRQPAATLLGGSGNWRIEGVVERNPNWTRDELILALDLYMRHRPAVLSKTSADVIELSEILNRLAHAGRDRAPTHRNANGVAMKLLNFRPFDPDYTASGRAGLHHTSRGDEQVWREFARLSDLTSSAWRMWRLSQMAAASMRKRRRAASAHAGRRCGSD